MGLLPAGAGGCRAARLRARRYPLSLPRALFVCVQNAGRSQLAQALYERRGGEARSAGSKPAEHVHAEVVKALAETGIDITGRTPRALSEDDVEWAELVVTMGCGDACPVLPGKRYVDWELPDPSEMSLAQVRALRGEIEQRVAEI